MLKLDDNIDLLKDEKAVAQFLRHVYIETIKGAILHVFCDNNIFDAWAQMLMFVDDLYTDDLIDKDELATLTRFINSVYLEFGDEKTRRKNSIIDIQNMLERGSNDNGKGERRCNIDSGRDTRGNGTSRKGETDRNTARKRN